MRKNILINISLLLLLGAGLISCSESLKKKFAAAQALRVYLGASNVVVGSSSSSSHGQTRVMSKLEFEGLDGSQWDEMGLEVTANLVAYKYYKAVGADDFKGDTHIAISLKTSDLTTYNYEFPLGEIKEVGDLLPVADKMAEACKKQDNETFRSLVDPQFLPDSTLGQMFYVNHFNDSVYAGSDRKISLKGIRFADSEDESLGLKLFSAIYTEESPKYSSFYQMNIDRKTKKIVRLVMNTDPKQVN